MSGVRELDALVQPEVDAAAGVRAARAPRPAPSPGSCWCLRSASRRRTRRVVAPEVEREAVERRSTAPSRVADTSDPAGVDVDVRIRAAGRPGLPVRAQVVSASGYAQISPSLGGGRGRRRVRAIDPAGHARRTPPLRAVRPRPPLHGRTLGRAECEESYTLPLTVPSPREPRAQRGERRGRAAPPCAGRAAPARACAPRRLARQTGERRSGEQKERGADHGRDEQTSHQKTPLHRARAGRPASPAPIVPRAPDVQSRGVVRLGTKCRRGCATSCLVTRR